MNTTLNRKWHNLDKLVNIRESLRAEGKKIIFTNGCFDVIHAGHIRYLHSARKLGDVLILAINDDNSVRKIKGKNRPVYPLAERAEILAAFPFISYITDFSSISVLPVIHKLKPDVLVKGGDYKIKQVIGWKFVQSYGGKVIVLDHFPGRSTTSTIQVMHD